MPPVFETPVSPLFEVRVPPVLIEARAASCPRPACLRFSRSLYLRLGFPTCNPRANSSYSNNYNYIYSIPFPLKTVEHCFSYNCYSFSYCYSNNCYSYSHCCSFSYCYSYSYSLLHNYCCITITTTLNIVTYYSLHSCIYNNNSRSTYS